MISDVRDKRHGPKNKEPNHKAGEQAEDCRDYCRYTKVREHRSHDLLAISAIKQERCEGIYREAYAGQKAGSFGKAGQT